MKSSDMKRFHLLDGGTGRNLMAAGMPAGVCVEQWIADNPQPYIDLVQAYVRAGSTIVYAPTFGANRWCLEKYGLGDRVEQLNTTLAGIAIKAAREVSPDVCIAGDLSPTGKLPAPLGDATFDEIFDVYREQGKALAKAGVDCFVVETMMNLQEVRAAILALREFELPILVTVTVDKNGRTMCGNPFASVVTVAYTLGAAAVGINCSEGPAGLDEIIRNGIKGTDIPIIAKPNAGLPNPDSPTGYDLTVEEFAEHMKKIFDVGVTALGGCCGTTPEHIAALREFVPVGREFGSVTYTTICGATERRVWYSPAFTEYTFTQELACDYDLEDELCSDEETPSAALVRIADEDEIEILCELATNSERPIAVICDSLELLEKTLREYCGVLIIKCDLPSTSLETAQQIAALANRYGAIFNYEFFC